MVVDCAFYSRGERMPRDGMTLAEAASCPRKGNNFVWIELHEPSRELMAEVSSHFGLHELAVEDAAVGAHQRPKVDPYDDFYFIVYRSARYDAPTNRVVFSELDLFLGAGFVIAVRHGEPADPEQARSHLEQYPHLLRSGPAAAVWAILDTVVSKRTSRGSSARCSRARRT
jgi:magnesium transporter